MSRLATYGFIFLIAAVAAVSCKKDTSPAPDLGYNYYPVKLGSWIIYDVDSTYYNLFTGQKEVYQFQVMELVDSILSDNSGRAMLRKKRFYREDATEDWTIGRIWSAVRTSDKVESNEENIKYVKLIFPVRKGKTWNGNAMNSDKESEYKYLDVHVASTINGNTFDSTAMIQHEADSNLIEKKVKKEMYAKNVGMVYKYFEDVAVQDTAIDFSKPFDERINTGVRYSYRINSYSK